MKRVSTLGIIAAAAFFCAAPLSLQWSPAKSPSLALDTANARIGHPGTAMSVAGVHRRAMRRTYGVGANRPVARAAAIGAATAGAGYYGAGYGWGGGWGGWGFNRPLFASATLGIGGSGFGLGGSGFGMTGAAFCYPTFDYSTGWNQFCPGTGFAFGTGSSHQ
jgi:hypothetical protein